MDFSPFLLSLKLALITSIILFIICLPLAYLLTYCKFRFKAIFEAIFALPLVLPPSVLGFYLLIFLSPNSSFGKFIEEHFDLRLVFNFKGLVIASCIYSLPFMFSALQSGFASVNKSLFEASYLLGKSKIKTIFFIILPNMKNNILNALVLSFAHTMGEFGVVLMIGGSVDKETKLASIAIFEATELLDYQKANFLSLLMLIVSFIILFLLYLFNQKSKI